MRLYIKVWALLVLLFIPVVVGIGASVGNAAPVRTPPTTLPDVEVIFGSSTNINFRENRRIGVDGVWIVTILNVGERASAPCTISNKIELLSGPNWPSVELNGTIKCPVLAQTESFTYVWPQGPTNAYLKAGVYRFTVEANSDHAFNEGNQKNNIQSWDFVVPPK